MDGKAFWWWAPEPQVTGVDPILLFRPRRPPADPDDQACRLHTIFRSTLKSSQ